MNEKLIKNVNKIMTDEEAAQNTTPQTAAAPPEAAGGTGQEAPPKSTTPALTMTLALFALMAVFFYHIYRIGVLPLPYMLALGGGLLILLLIVALLSWNREKKGRCAVGIGLTVLLSGILLFGIFYTSKFLDMIKRVTAPFVKETVVMELYVRDDDPARSLSDMADYRFSILNVADRDLSDKALAQIENRLKKQITPEEYGAPTQLVNALLSGEAQSILISSSLKETALEALGLPHNEPRLRLIESFRVEYEGQKPSQAEEPAPRTEDLPAEMPEGWRFSSRSGIFAIYISGIDDRDGLSSRSLSDVNIIAVVNTNTHQVLLINTPRDFFVKTPVSGDARDKLTHAGLYGVDVSRQTLENLYGMDIDYVFKLDFKGFIRIIDALGGIDVESDADFTAEDIHFVKGMNHLTGYQALLFARIRKGLEGGDRARGRHQMAIIQAVAQKAASPEILKNYDAVLAALSGSFETTVPYDKASAVVREQLAQGGLWHTKTYSVTGSDSFDNSFTFPDRNYVMVPDMATIEEARRLMWDLFRGVELP